MQHTFNPSGELSYWLQIILGLSTDEILQIVESGKLKEVEEATTALATVLEWRCPTPNRLN